MVWVNQSVISAEASADEPIKGSTIRKVQANITAAFSGDAGGPELASNLAGAAYAGLPLDAVGMHRQIISTQSNTGSTPSAPANAYTPGSSYSAASLGLVAGTWRHLGGGFAGGFTQSGEDAPYLYVYWYVNLFVRVV